MHRGAVVTAFVILNAVLQPLKASENFLLPSYIEALLIKVR
jgi:hypothetical protein